MASGALLARARAVLRANDAGAFTKPGLRQYPHQWNWDSAVIALGLAEFDLPRALLEIRSLLSGQWRDGMLPHIVFHTAASDYFPPAGFWQIEASPNAPAVATSGLTQPPLLATALRRIHARRPIPGFLREVYPALLRWHRWLHTARDVDGSGLACVLHPWESGTDDSPRWLHVLAGLAPRDLPPYQRGDATHVPPGERPLHADYERFVYLLEVMRRNKYDQAQLLAQAPVLVQDVLFNAVLHRADQDLRALALELGQPAGEIEGWLAAMPAAFNARLWDEARGLYLDYDARRNVPIPVNTALTFTPLFAGLASPQQARRLIEEHWLNPAEYAPDERTRYRLTTTSKAEPQWEARRYWRGPIWILLNWLLYDGLQRYGYADLARALRQDTLELVQGGYWEYYDPRDGSGCGSSDFSWSAALTIDLLEESPV